MSKKHIWSTKNLGPLQKEQSGKFFIQNLIKEKIKVNQIPDSSGIMNTNVVEKNINYIAAQSDQSFMYKGGRSGVFMCRDRPSTFASGYGGKGAQGAEAMDIVVGRMSSGDLSDGAYVHPSFAGDAARIYISQMTDVDLNFGLADGITGEIKARSAVAIKADAVRLIGREGVKIVSGRSFAFKAGPGGEKNSRGGKIKQPAPPIELIAGNNDEDHEVAGGLLGASQRIRGMQGVARGENMRDCLRELSDILGNVIGAVHNLVLIQTVYNSINGIDFFRPWMATVGAVSSTQFLAHVQNSLWQSRINKIMWEINYTYPFGYKYIPSRNVFSN